MTDKELAMAAIREAQAEIDAERVWYNRETGEVFGTREEAVQDAAELYDFGDWTNPVGFDELPYIELPWGRLRRLLAAFGGAA